MNISTDKYAVGTVAARRDLAADLWVLRIKPDCSLPYRPGQYVTLGLDIGDRVVERPYSIASSPAETEVELFIERVPDGELSARLHALAVGDRVLMRRRVKGLFLKDAPVEGRRHLLVATVTGVAPFVSLLRTLVSAWRAGGAQPSAVLLLQGAAAARELGYCDELTALDADCPWFTYVPTVSRPWDDPEWAGETGRVDDVLRKYADQHGFEPNSAAAFLCGNPAMIHNSRQIMHRRGFANADIREEQYWPE